MAGLTDPSATAEERIAAANALGTSKDPLAVETLIRGLGTTDEALTRAVVDALKAQKAAPVLAKRLADANTVETRKVQACLGLRHLKDPACVPVLAAALKDESALVRREVALALTVIGPAPAEGALLAALSDSDGDVRYGVAEALGEVKSAKARQALEAQLVKESNPTVRSALEGAVRRCATPA